jgi:hypothetical protein
MRDDNHTTTELTPAEALTRSAEILGRAYAEFSTKGLLPLRQESIPAIRQAEEMLRRAGYPVRRRWRLRLLPLQHRAACRPLRSTRRTRSVRRTRTTRSGCSPSRLSDGDSEPPLEPLTGGAW